MIRLHKLHTHERHTHVSCETLDEALKQFDIETPYIIARCSSDEEWLGLKIALNAKNENAVKAAQLASVTAPTCAIWQSPADLSEGEGWRTLWTQVVMTGQPQGGSMSQRRRG